MDLGKVSIKRRSILWGVPAVAAGLLAGCSSPDGSPQADRILSISLNQTETHPSYAALSSFGTMLAQATDQRIGARVYPNENLGAQQEVIQLVSDGSVDMAVVSSIQMENLSKRFLPLGLPGVFSSIDHLNRVLKDERIVGRLFSSLEESKNLLVLGGFTQGARHLYTTKGPINSPEDLAGMKIRVQESDVFLKLIDAMGGSPTPMAYGEVYTALQAGVLDGAENNEVSYVTQRHNEIAKHFTMTNHLVGVDYIIINAHTLASFSSQDQERVREIFHRTQDEFVDRWRKKTDESISQMKESGVQINNVSPDAFGPAIDSVAQSFLDNPDDKRLYETVRDQAKEGDK